MAALAIGDSAPDLELLGPDERAVRLSEYWKRQATVVVFLRHFG